MLYRTLYLSSYVVLERQKSAPYGSINHDEIRYIWEERESECQEILKKYANP